MSVHSLGRSRSQPGYRGLEERCLLAGNVTVFENVHLFIRGDVADNQFELVVEDDQLKINGLDGTTINNEDSYVVAGATVTDSGVTFEGGLRAHLGPGHDELSITDAQFEDFSIVYGGTGNDNIELLDSTFNDNATFQTYEGRDTISANGSRFEGALRAITLDGQDTVSIIDSTFAGNSIVTTGNHADSIHLDGNHYAGDVNLVLPLNGDDTVRLDNPVVSGNQLGIFLGNGDDTIHGDLTEASVASAIRVGGQGGVDQVLAIPTSAEVAVDVTVDVEDRLVFDNGTGGVSGVEAASPAFFNSVSDNLRNANDFQLDTTETISRISWSGRYSGDVFEASGEPFQQDDFTIEFYEGIFFNGEPYAPDGDPIATFNVGNDVNRTDSGIDLPLDGGDLYEFSADIDITLEAGKTYWVSIFAASEGEVPGNAFGGDFNHFQWGFQTAYSAFDVGQGQFENTSVYTFGDFRTSDPGWFNDFNSRQDAPQDFQLWL